MNVKEAAAAARNYITSENPGLVNVPLDLEEAVPDPARREWRVTLSFTRPGGQQGQQSVSTPRSYKEIIINDTDGSPASMTDSTPCASKSCKIPTQGACTTGQCVQPGYVAPAPMSLWSRTLSRTLFLCKAAVRPVRLTIGWGSLITLIAEAAFGDLVPISDSVLVCTAIIGLIAEGLRQQRQASQRPNDKECHRRPEKCRCRRPVRCNRNA